MSTTNHTDRTGLYIMVFFAMLNSCSASHDAGEARKELKRLADQVVESKLAGPGSR